MKKKVHGHRRIDGVRKSPTYQSWANMKDRCNNPSRPNYEYYGAKGVKVCKRWEEFSNFLEDMGERPSGKSLDRINPNGHYEPSNCRWADSKVQAWNKRKAS